VRFLVLGSTRAVADAELDLGARKPRSIVAALAMTPGRTVSADLLADLVWAGEPPRAAHGALHSYLSGLRRVLEPDRPSRGAASLIETTDHGYVLRVAPGDVDAHAFAETAARVGRDLSRLGSQLTGAGPGRDWPTRDQVMEALADVDAGLTQWQGEPYADLPDHSDVLAARTSLEQLRMAAEEARLLGLLALGEHASVLAATETAIGPHQLRERLWALHAVALVRAGRQADALEALRTVRGVLAEDLGIDPGAELRGLEDAVLQQRPGLDLALPRASVPVVASPARPVSLSPGPAQATATVGRERERAALEESVQEAFAGRASFVQLVGEPGIGKSHLVDHLVALARDHGVRVGVGRCARDDGAPPMWPWRSALAELGVDVDLAAAGDPDASPEQRAFELSERVGSALLASCTAPTLVVLEDLHWSDDAALRALTRLVDGAPADVPLSVVLTRRSHPAPSGSLATLGEALARRHAVRLDLVGLEPDGAADLIRAAARRSVPDGVSARWRERAGGNPFFLIELARLGVSDHGPLPATVRDVVSRRLADLPEATLERLQTAAVIGAQFTLATTAEVDGRDRDEVADDLDRAVALGLVVEVGPEQYAFAHAMTQESVLATMSGTRAARRHARVAHALQDPPDHLAGDRATLTAELARHWLAAGPSHVDSAWQAARSAADQASELASFPEALRLRSAAVEAHRRVPGGADGVHYDLLLELATEAAYAARWPDVEAAVLEAMALGRMLGSPRLVGQAAVAMTRYCNWLPHVIDAVFEDAIDDLRWGLAHVEDDVPTRCRLQLALAVELYYVEGAAAERQALAESGMVLARSVADPSLVAWAAGAACMVAWNPAQLADRLAWAEEGVVAARAAADPRAEAVLLMTLATAQVEAGDRAGWESSVGGAESIATRERLAYPMMTLHWQRLGMAALRGDADRLAAELESLTAVVADIALPSQEMQIPFAKVAARLWDPEGLHDLVDMFAAAHDEHVEGGTMVHLVLARTGRVEDLRRSLDAFPMPVEDELYWSTLSDWTAEAEAASVAGDVALARRAVDALTPYRGRLTVAGATVVDGCVDLSLALAHATCGELAVASELADSGAAQAEAWGFTELTAWLARHRARLGF
jgi:DNA-binding SARP family transcriptional activator